MRITIITLALVCRLATTATAKETPSTKTRKELYILTARQLEAAMEGAYKRHGLFYTCEREPEQRTVLCTRYHGEQRTNVSGHADPGLWGYRRLHYLLGGKQAGRCFPLSSDETAWGVGYLHAQGVLREERYCTHMPRDLRPMRAPPTRRHGLSGERIWRAY